MKRITIPTLIITMTLLLAVSTALAKNNTFDLNWLVLSSVGRESSGGDYALSGPVGQSNVGQMSGGEYEIGTGSVSLIGPSATSGEVWRPGFTREGGLTYDAVIGRVNSATAAFRSNRNTADLYYIFPASASQATIQSAQFYILDRTGTYPTGNVTLTLEIYNYAGTLQHTVSAAAVDMETTATGTWTTVTLSSTATDLEIVPGEFLAFHFNLSGGSADNLDVRSMFEVEVGLSGSDGGTSKGVYLPIILRN